MSHEPARPLVLAALEEELHPLLSRGRPGPRRPAGPGMVGELTLEGRTLWVGWSGMGPEKAGRTARWVAAELRPCWVLLTGYAGGTLTAHAPGQLVLASEVRRAGSPALTPAAELLLRARRLEGLHEGPFETFKAPIYEPEEKQALAATGLCALEMETHAAAGELERAHIPWMALRVILDSVAHSLRGIERFTTPGGGVRPLALAASLLRDPPLALRLARLAAARRAADRALAPALIKILTADPADP